MFIDFLLECEFSEMNWPDFLDGVLFWDDGTQLHILWQGQAYKLQWAHLFQRIPQFLIN